MPRPHNHIPNHVNENLRDRVINPRLARGLFATIGSHDVANVARRDRGPYAGNTFMRKGTEREGESVDDDNVRLITLRLFLDNTYTDMMINSA